MSAGKYSFTIEQGATYRFGIEYTDASGSYIDLQGYDAKMQIRSDYADNTKNKLFATLPLITSSEAQTGSYLAFSGSMGTGSAAAISGALKVYLHADTTATFTFEEAVYDIELYSGDEVYRLLEGTILNKKEVTRI
jgi:hypothetical protein